MSKHWSWMLLLLSGLFMVGCQTAPLGGTTWDVIEYYGPERTRIPEFKKMVLEFTQDGKILSTITGPDGAVTIFEEDRYRVNPKDKLITVTTPEWTTVAMYRFDGKKLRIHSERFIVVLEPITKKACCDKNKETPCK